MGTGSRAVVLGLALAAAALCETRPARADATKDACFDAYEQAQQLRKKGQLRAAQTQLLRCAAKACPAFVANDCTQWSRDVEASLPSAIFVAKDPQGSDLVDVVVSVDNAEVQRRIDGRAVPIDPGVHMIRYEWGGETVEVKVILVEGEKGRRVEVTFAGPRAAVAPPPPPPPAPPASIPTASIVLGGVGVAAGAAFAVFALMGKGAESCAPGCSRAQVDTLRRDYLIADISWITGLVAVGAAVTIWLLQRPASAPSAATR
jgi:hypothetical protein